MHLRHVATLAVLTVAAGCSQSAPHATSRRPTAEPGVQAAATADTIPTLSELLKRDATQAAAQPPATATRRAATLAGSDLQAVALQVSDLPEGFKQVTQRITTNPEFAALTSAPVAVLQLLDRWGRIVGFDNDFTRSGAAARGQPGIVSSSIHLYPDAEHAGQAWAGQETLVLQTAKVKFEGPVHVDLPAVGDQFAAVRMGTTEAGGQRLLWYWLYFRRGRIEADVTTVTPTAQDDHGALAVRLARLLDDRIATLPQ